MANYSLIKDINNIINYTSNRTSLGVKSLTSFPRSILTLNWVTEQIDLSASISKTVKERKFDIYSGYYPKRKLYFRKLRRVLLSKPLFKHTSFNLIIDLFIYNNKKYRFRRLRNISVRRGLYKYMYSMYVDYSQKIKETINRPRFFYINLIEPKTYNYYNLIVSTYGNILMKKNIPFFLYICLLMLQFNYFFKQKVNVTKNYILNQNQEKLFINTALYKNTNINNIYNNHNNNDENKENISFKRCLYKKNIKPQISNSSIKTRKTINTDIYNIQKNKIEEIKVNSDLNEKKKVKKSIKIKKSKYLIYKNYLEDLERKSSTPLDLNTLSL
jgi:hypothetical protein